MLIIIEGSYFEYSPTIVVDCRTDESLWGVLNDNVPDDTVLCYWLLVHNWVLYYFWLGLAPIYHITQHINNHNNIYHIPHELAYMVDELVVVSVKLIEYHSVLLIFCSSSYLLN